MISEVLTADDLFSCQRCGDCCKGYGGTYLTETDIDRICRYLGMKRERFMRDICQMCRRWPFIDSILADAGNWRAMAATCPGMRVDVSDDQVERCIRAMIQKPR